MTESYYTVDTLEPPTSIGFLVKRCGVLMSQIAERRFASEPVSFAQWLVMANLGRFDQLSATALSEETGYDMGALTRIVDGLESLGLVRRERSERDRRAVEIALTTEGRRRVQSTKRLVVELLNELVAPYSKQEIETLIGLMQRMLVRLQEAAQASSGVEPQAAPRAQGAARSDAATPMRTPRGGRGKTRQNRGV